MKREEIITTAKKNKKLKIGDILYKYVPLKGIFSYEVCGFLDNSILVKSKVCRSSNEDSCVVEINPLEGRNDVYKFVSLYNSCKGCVSYSDDENGEEVCVDRDYVYHNTIDGNYYFPTKRKAAKGRVDAFISEHKRDIRNKQERIDRLKEEIKTIEKRIADLEVWLNELPD